MNLRNSSIYQVFTRNHSGNGNFVDLIKDLDRISQMGFEFLYLCPIHPIGEKCRKGDLGSPYAIKNYYEINEEYGTMEDFERLVSRCHDHNLKLIIDIVINHSSPDCVYTRTNPEFYYRDSNGNFANRVEDWTDVIDFNYSNKGLREEMINMLSYWAKKGVDGFRCDVATLVPYDFWISAREAINKINKDFVWIAESGEYEFIESLRRNGYQISTDYQLFEAFDVLYSYDIKSFFTEAYGTEKNLKFLAKLINYQNSEFDLSDLKLKYLENHDNERIFSLLNNKNKVINYLAFMYLQRGVPFVYAGQEAWCKKTPSLFTRDMLDWSQYDEEYALYIKKLNCLKKLPIFSEERYCHISEQDDYFEVTLSSANEEFVGVYNVLDLHGNVKTCLKDGTYTNLINNEKVVVNRECIDCKYLPLFVKVRGYDDE